MLASEHFKITRTDSDDWFDTILDGDTELFVDPFLVFRDADGFWAGAHDEIIAHFNRAFMLIAEGNLNPDSLAYQKALDLLVFKEPKEMCLGYTAKGSSGSGSGDVFAKLIGKAITDAIQRGLKNPRHFEELGILNEGIGADRISDITCTILKRRLIEYTRQIASRHGVAIAKHTLYGAGFDEQRQRWETLTVEVPTNPLAKNKGPLLLVPQRFLRRLPALNPDEWWDSFENEKLRRDVNYHVMGKVDKATIVAAARAHPEDVRAWAEAREKATVAPYDISKDPNGLWQWDPVTRAYVAKNPLKLAPAKTPEEFFGVVDLVAKEFRHFVEEAGGWKLLWDGSSEKIEGASQLLFQGIAKSHCKANDISVDREVDLGCGTVDLKFSTGYSKRALLEVKKLENTKFWHGLSEQLPTYLKSDEVADGWFLVVRFRDGKQWDKRLLEVQQEISKVAEERGVNIRYVYVDARPRESASKK